jgi:hypothetical protein
MSQIAVIPQQSILKETSVNFKVQQHCCRQEVLISHLNLLYRQPALNLSVISIAYLAGICLYPGVLFNGAVLEEQHYLLF